MRRGVALLLALLSIAAVAAFAAPPYQRPAGIADDKEPLIVAGYRALFTCSAHFFAGRPLDDIKKVELVDVEGMGYPDPVIDERRKVVTATDISGQIVRIAAFRETMGCSVLPPNWQMGDVPRLPYVQYAAAARCRELAFPGGGSRQAACGWPRHALSCVGAGAGACLRRQELRGRRRRRDAAVIVLKEGKIVAERYRPGFGVYSGYRTWSTAKSISSALLAIAAKQGLLDLDAPVSIPEWSYPGDPRQVDHIQAVDVDVERAVQRRRQHLRGLFRRTGCGERRDDHAAGSHTRLALEVREQRHAAPAAVATSSARGRSEIPAFPLRRAVAPAGHVPHAHGGRSSRQLRWDRARPTRLPATWRASGYCWRTTASGMASGCCPKAG